MYAPALRTVPQCVLRCTVMGTHTMGPFQVSSHLLPHLLGHVIYRFHGADLSHVLDELVSLVLCHPVPHVFPDNHREPCPFISRQTP
jgi:hypothetical protein